MKNLHDLKQITPAALLNMPTSAQLELLDELEYRAYLVRTVAGIQQAYRGFLCFFSFTQLNRSGSSASKAAFIFSRVALSACW